MSSPRPTPSSSTSHTAGRRSSAEKEASSVARAASSRGRRSRAWAMWGRLSSPSSILSNRFSHHMSVPSTASRTAPVSPMSPRKSRRLRCRARKEMTGTARSAAPPSTKLATFGPSDATNPGRPAWLTSHRISSSRNRTTASKPIACAAAAMRASPTSSFTQCPLDRAAEKNVAVSDSSRRPRASVPGGEATAASNDAASHPLAASEPQPALAPLLPPPSRAKNVSSPSRSRWATASRSSASLSCSSGSGTSPRTSVGSRRICSSAAPSTAASRLSAPTRWNDSRRNRRPSRSARRPRTGWSAVMPRAAGSWPSRACRTAMKWLLPDPKEPWTKAAWLCPPASAWETSPSARSKALASAGVTT